MRFRKIYLATSLLFLCSLTRSQETIAWQTGEKLKWEYFAGPPNRKLRFKAVTGAGINYSFTIHKGNKVSYRVECVFYKKKSWVKTRTDSLLAHEQGHFDIAEIFARRLRKEFNAYELRVMHAGPDLEKIWLKLIAGKDAMNNAYDKETTFGENRRIQELWGQRIEDELKTMEMWTDNP